MNYRINERIEQINIENYIWLIYLVIIALSYIGNKYEKDFFLYQNQKDKNIYRNINAFIFIILIIIYSYYEKDALKSFLSKGEKTKKQKEYDSLILLASTFVLISGIIFLYIIISDTDLDTEIAFN